MVTSPGTPPSPSPFARLRFRPPTRTSSARCRQLGLRGVIGTDSVPSHEEGDSTTPPRGPTKVEFQGLPSGLWVTLQG